MTTHEPRGIRIAPPTVRLGPQVVSAFHAFGLAGFVSSALLGLVLAHRLGLSLPITLLVTAVADGTFFALAMTVKVLTGRERLVYYHHEIAILCAVALLLLLLGAPVLPYLDVTALGIGLFLVFGRLGCLRAGCCHGRPHRWGVRYGAAHGEAGFPAALVGVRIFPVQAAESVAALGIVAAGVALALTGPPGAALAWYVVAYGAARWLLELARGDEDRPYALGVSQAQWISLAGALLVAAAERAGALPAAGWHDVAAAGLSAATLLLVARHALARDVHKDAPSSGGTPP